MKIKMIFGTLLPSDDESGKQRDLACGEEYDLPKAVAVPLIGAGRAELVGKTAEPQA